MLIPTYEALLRRAIELETMTETEVMKRFFTQIRRRDWRTVTPKEKKEWRIWYRKTRAKMTPSYFLSSWFGRQLFPYKKDELSIS